MKQKNRKKIIEFAPQDKITAKAHELIFVLFNIDGFLSNESVLEDFLSFRGANTHNLPKETWEKVVELRRSEWMLKIKDTYGVLLPEILEGESRIWRIINLIHQKQLMN